MKAFGFSTGALAKGDVAEALRLVSNYETDAVEYSALRLDELEPTVAFLLQHGTGAFRYVAIHAPSRIPVAEEARVVALLRQLVAAIPVRIVIHPDVVHDPALWQTFGQALCVENMDHRKPIGRTAEELDAVFAKLPEARLCFDIGHAHEVERSMSIGYEILRWHGHRLAHVHASEVSDECEHRGFSTSSLCAFKKLAGMLPPTTPIILETDVADDRFESQLNEAKHLFAPAL